MKWHYLECVKIPRLRNFRSFEPFFNFEKKKLFRPENFSWTTEYTDMNVLQMIHVDVPILQCSRGINVDFKVILETKSLIVWNFYCLIKIKKKYTRVVKNLMIYSDLICFKIRQCTADTSRFKKNSYSKTFNSRSLG